jgi:glutathione S-transferase
VPDKGSGGGGDVKALRAAAKGLLYPSESDKPVKAFRWEGAAPPEGDVDEAALRAHIEAPPRAVIKAIPLERFFEPVSAEQDWFGEEERKAARRFRALQQVLQDNLTGVQAFRVEDNPSLVDVYVLGRTAGGEVVGVSAQLVET